MSLRIKRGDDAIFTLKLTDAKGDYLNLTGGTVKFIARKRLGDESPTLDKTCAVTDALHGYAEVSILGEDTSDFPYATALPFDVEFTDGSAHRQIVIQDVLYVDTDIAH